MTKEDLQKALAKDKREIVDVNLGQIPIRPTIGRGGQYSVQVQSTPKESAYTQLSTALNQFPQLAGQYKNLQQAQGVAEVQAMSVAELEELAKKGDEGAKETLLNRFKKEAIDEELYNQLYETKIGPALKEQERVLSQMPMAQMEKDFFEDANGGALNSEQVTQKISDSYSAAIPDYIQTMVDATPNQSLLHNRLLRQIPGWSSRSIAVMDTKRQKWINDSALAGIDSSLNQGFSDNSGLLEHGDTNVEVEDDAGISQLTQQDGFSMLPPMTGEDETEKPPVLKTDLSVYSPQKGGKLQKMEGGLKSSKPGSDGKSIVRTLEDFRKDPENTVVTVAGNPQFYGRRYVVKQMQYETADGKQYTLTNVPVLVHDTGGRFTNSPEGRFDVPVEQDTDNRTMAINQGLLKGISFIRDQGNETEKGTPVKLKAADVTAQRKADIAFKMHSASMSIMDTIKSTHIALLDRPGTNFKNPDVARGAVYQRAERHLADMILDGQHVQVNTFIEMARENKGGEFSLDGNALPPDMLTSLELKVRAQENYINNSSDTERTEADKELTLEFSKRLAVLATTASQGSPKEAEEALLAVEQEALGAFGAGDLSKEGLKEFIKARDEFSDSIGRSAGTSWGGLFQTEGFKDQLATLLDPRAEYSSTKLSETALLAVAQKNNIDLSSLQEPDDFDDWSGPKKVRWLAITNGITSKARSQAIYLTTEKLARRYQDAAERDPTKILTFPARNEEGEAIVDENGDPTYINAQQLYRNTLDETYNTELTRLLQDTTEQQKLIDNAALIRGKASVSVGETELDRRVEAEALEEEVGRDDFLDSSGKSTRARGGEAPSDFLNRWVKTAQNPVALSLMAHQTPPDQLAKDIENVSYRMNQKYMTSVAKAMQKAKNAKDEVGIRSQFIAQTQYIGLPMDMHEGAMVVETPTTGGYNYNYILGTTNTFLPRKSINLNQDSRYSNVSTAKSHVYSYSATREAGYAKPNYTKLDTLYDIHFKGQEDTYTRETFYADQVALGKELNIIPNNTNFTESQ